MSPTVCTRWVGGGEQLPSQPYPALIRANEGEKVLLRFINLGYQQHSIQVLGIPLKVVGQDARQPRGLNGEDLSYWKNALYWMIMCPTINLWATDGHISMPDGNSIYIWGFREKVLPPSAPGPHLVVNQGETVMINLTNTLAENVSIRFPGAENVMVVHRDGSESPAQPPPPDPTPATGRGNLHGGFAKQGGTELDRPR